MFPKTTLVFFTLISCALGQGIGTYQAETHPSLTWQKCTAGGGCTSTSGSVVLDSNWRWVHTAGDYTNCYTGNTWDSTLCSDNVACAQNCVLEGADYSGTYGISTSGNALTLKFIQPNSNGKNVGSRVYLMESDSKYQMFNVLNQEFTFDVDVSGLPCGLNGALYFSAMEADGGLSRFPTNKAGAKYGTGYCDSQCPRDIKFINGEEIYFLQANAEGWSGSDNDPNAGMGNYGTCCNEMDIWEANSISTAYTPHPCDGTQQERCEGDACGGADNRYGSICDPDGCDFNSFRMGDQSFYGPGATVDTSSKFTVVTQFLTDSNSTSGTLSEIRRLYVQNGRVIQNSVVNVPGMTAGDSITQQYCDEAKAAFGDTDSFGDHGGLAGISASMQVGMVLVMSVWDDHAANMLWLDSNYPTDADASQPGTARGTCPTSSGAPADVEASAANAQGIYSNIKFGDIGSTFTAA
ncbi:cellobiohydrolase I-II [Crassisporium funariophilum]|nr:cellobiohydrolase I-II [Crassisporium funariophilum]